MITTSYGFQVSLGRIDFISAVEKVRKALEREGFGIITEIDLAKSFQQKLGVEFRPYSIFGACNPTLARRAIEIDPKIGLLLPCNVVVEEAPEGVLVSIADPKAMLALAASEKLTPIAEEARGRLLHVVAHLEERPAHRP
jgi:uncharacterized protein (DUF302 family)